MSISLSRVNFSGYSVIPADKYQALVRKSQKSASFDVTGFRKGLKELTGDPRVDTSYLLDTSKPGYVSCRTGRDIVTWCKENGPPTPPNATSKKKAAG